MYEVLRHGKSMADVTVKLSQQGGIWTLHGHTHNMRGLADFLNARGEQTVTGHWSQGSFVPDHFRFSFSVIGFKSLWEAAFDWPAETVTTNTRKGTFNLPLAENALDPLSLMLNTPALLKDAPDRMTVNVVDEDEIKSHVYEAEYAEFIESELGCLDTTLVKRIRENSKRKSQIWYANDYHHVPVLIQHVKKRRKGLRMEIRSLKIAGQTITPVDQCNSDEQQL